MRIMGINNVVPGMVLGKTVLGFSSQNLLNAGTTLTEEYIQKLRALDIMSVYIVDENTEGIEIEDVVCEQTRLEAGRVTKEAMDKIRLGKGIDHSKVDRIISKIIDDLLDNRDLVIRLVDIRSLNDYSYFHSVNVAILSGIIGIRLKYSFAQLQQLMVGALFHDLGKTLLAELPEDQITAQPEDKKENMRKHPQLGYDILKQNKAVSILSANVALQHHERYDGQGYPRNLTGSEIHDYSKIVAITNTYDRLTTDYPNKPKIPPHQAVEFLMVNSGYAFDPDLVNVFIQCVALYPEGTIVRLNTGEKAIIIKSYFGFPTRPRIRILIDKEGKKIQYPQTIELYKNPTYFILEVLDKLD